MNEYELQETQTKDNSVLNVYENTVQLIGPLPEQYHCIYFLGMIAYIFVIFAVVLSPLILLRGTKR